MYLFNYMINHAEQSVYMYVCVKFMVSYKCLNWQQFGSFFLRGKRSTIQSIFCQFPLQLGGLMSHELEVLTKFHFVLRVQLSIFEEKMIEFCGSMFDFSKIV